MISFFMGANSRRGFYSLFDTASGTVSVVKGTSGSGKSTLLKSLCKDGCERILCSSDHSSLDGVICGDRSVFDGTAPHVCEPSATGKYILMPQSDLSAHKDTLLNIKKSIKQDYDAAYTLISSAAAARDAVRDIFLSAFSGERFLRRAGNILKREKAPAGKTRYRFLDSISADGFVCLNSTVAELADRIIEVEDTFGLSEGFFTILKEGFEGTDAIICPSPLDPLKTRHIILPSLSLAFVTSDELCKYSGTVSRVLRETAYINKEALACRKFEIKLLKNLEETLLQSAYKHLRSAKDKHMELEAVIRPHLDINAINRLIESMDGSF